MSSPRRKGHRTRKPREDFERHFEGPEMLAELLSAAGSPLSVDEVAQKIRQGRKEGRTPAEVFPTFFEGEPRFSHPSMARLLFQNLFGLWDVLQSGKPWTPQKTKREKPAAAAPPPLLTELGPDESFVEKAQGYLGSLGARERARLQDAFENRQDALLTWLDESSLTDDGYQAARNILFEFFALLMVGWPAGLRNVTPRELKSGGFEPRESPPDALDAYARKALAASGSAEEQIREVVRRGFLALWNARKT